MASQSSCQGLFAQLSARDLSRTGTFGWLQHPVERTKPSCWGGLTPPPRRRNSRAQQSPAGPPCPALPAAGQLPWAVPHRGSPAHSSAAELPQCPGAGSRVPSAGMLVCKLPLYHIIMRCLGYQQISRRLGREGCSTIRKCQLAASSFCRSLNPIFLTCISAMGTGPLHSDEPPGELQNIAMETLQRSWP